MILQMRQLQITRKIPKKPMAVSFLLFLPFMKPLAQKLDRHLRSTTIQPSLETAKQSDDVRTLNELFYFKEDFETWFQSCSQLVAGGQPSTNEFEDWRSVVRKILNDLKSFRDTQAKIMNLQEKNSNSSTTRRRKRRNY